VTAIVMLGLSGALAVAYVPDTIVQRLATTGESVEDLSIGGRFRIWKAGANAFARRPLMGYGVSSFKTAVTPDLGANTQIAHNSYVSVLVEEGLIGFLLYSLLLFSILLAILKLPRPERRFALILYFTTLVSMLPLTLEDHKAIWVVFGVLIGLSAVQRTALSHTAPARTPLRPSFRPQPAGRLGQIGIPRTRDNTP
jgi:O-antigen ligase